MIKRALGLVPEYGHQVPRFGFGSLGLVPHQWLRQISMKLLFLTPLFYWLKVILIVPVNLVDRDSDFFPALSLGLFFALSTAIS